MFMITMLKKNLPYGNSSKKFGNYKDLYIPATINNILKGIKYEKKNNTWNKNNLDYTWTWDCCFT